MEMKHIRWWEEDDTTTPTLRRLVRLCDYLDSANYRDATCKSLLGGRRRNMLKKAEPSHSHEAAPFPA